MSETNLSLGDVARLFKLPVWKVRRLYERKLVDPAARVGNYRVVPSSDIPRLEAALLDAGYLSLPRHDPAN